MIFDLLFLQQPRPAVGADIRRGQLNYCDGLWGEGYVVSAAGVQAALLADVGGTGRLRVAPGAAPCKCPMLDHGSFRISGPVQANQGIAHKRGHYIPGGSGDMAVTDQPCENLSLIKSLLQYRFATPNPLKARPGPEGCRTAPLGNL